MKVFEELERSDQTPQRYSESSFSYLDRSGRQSAIRARDRIEDWFTRYPNQAKAELRVRLRSPDDSDHLAAFFELLLHELLVALNCEVTIHPTVISSDRTPDFLVSPPMGSEFFLEATLATGVSETESADRARENVVYDALNNLESPDFFLALEVSGAPSTPPSAKKIRHFLQQKLESLNATEITRAWETGDYGKLPIWHYKHDGWEISFCPIPKSSSTRGKRGARPIGIIADRDFNSVDSRTPLRRAIERKATAYGKLDKPYVVAVNSLDHNVIDSIDIAEALFGTETWVVNRPSGWEMYRENDGLWKGPSGPRNTRVSGVLLFRGMYPNSVESSDSVLVINSMATHPYDSVLLSLPTVVVRDGKLSWQEGIHPAKILGLTRM